MQNWRFGGREFDTQTSTYDWGFRNYAPTEGMFTSSDAMSELNYSMSPYTFANDNPVNYTDLFGLKTFSIDELARNWRSFDVNEDDVALQQIVCKAPKPMSFETIYDGFEDKLGNFKDYTELAYNINLEYGGSKLSQPLWNMATYVKNNNEYLSKNLKLSTFHPSDVYRGLTRNINKVARYGKIAGRVSLAMDAIKIGLTTDVQASDALDCGMTLLTFIPGYGWMIAGGYLLLDTSVYFCTGESLGDHLNDFTRENYGYDTFEVKTLTFK